MLCTATISCYANSMKFDSQTITPMHIAGVCLYWCYRCGVKSLFVHKSAHRCFSDSPRTLWQKSTIKMHVSTKTNHKHIEATRVATRLSLNPIGVCERVVKILILRQKEKRTRKTFSWRKIFREFGCASWSSQRKKFSFHWLIN